jgi:hypothetical protein
LTRIVDWLASRLPEDERDAVLGDLIEAGASNGPVIRELLGLLARRQAILWKSWQPWLALFGLVVIAGMFLSEFIFHFQVALHEQLRTSWPYGEPVDTLLPRWQNIIYLASVLLALFGWTWTGGFVLGRLSGPATWITGPLFWLMCVDSFPARLRLLGSITFRDGDSIPTILLRWLLPLNPGTAALLAAVVYGAVAGVRSRARGTGYLRFPAGTTIVLTTLVFCTGSWKEAAWATWSEGAMQGMRWPSRLLPLTLLSWPAIYMLAIANLRHRRTTTL